MGTSKGILLSGVAMIIGFYAVGIKKADSVLATATITRSNVVQAEDFAQAAVRIALNRYETTGSTSSGSRTILPDPTGAIPSYTAGTASWGSMSINFWTWPWTATVRGTGQYNNTQVIVRATAQMDPSTGYWTIVKLWTNPKVKYASYDAKGAFLGWVNDPQYVGWEFQTPSP